MDSVKLSELKSLPADDLRHSLSAEVVADGEFVALWIVPPTDWLKADIINQVEEVEKLLGKRR